MIFVATLLGRPIGAALFGHLGDRIGRRRTAIIYQTSLSSFMPKEYTPVVLLVIGGAMTAAGAALGPESRDVDMWEEQ